MIQLTLFLILQIIQARQHSGFIEIDHQTGANIFYWYIPAPASYKTGDDIPLIVWLQGGPGASSLIGMFFELGPYKLDFTSNPPTLKTRTIGNWNANYHLLFIDQPVGTGYSFARDTRAYATNSENDVARDMYIFFGKFYLQYPALKRSPLFIAGESYAGHWIPAIAAHFLRQNTMPLQGILIGDGLIDPVTQVRSKPDQAIALGLIDHHQHAELVQLSELASQAALAGKYEEALGRRYTMEQKVFQYSGGANLYDIRVYKSYDFDRIEKWANLKRTKEWLNIPNAPKFTVHNRIVNHRMSGDVMRSLKHLFPEILDKIPVLLYQGQFDFKDGYLSTQQWIEDINWDGKEGFRKAKRLTWKTKNGEIAGYVRQHENLREILVLGAGHLVPMDKPQAAFEMVDNFILSCVYGNSGPGNPTILRRSHELRSHRNLTWIDPL